MVQVANIAARRKLSCGKHKWPGQAPDFLTLITLCHLLVNVYSPVCLASWLHSIAIVLLHISLSYQPVVHLLVLGSDFAIRARRFAADLIFGACCRR